MELFLMGNRFLFFIGTLLRLVLRVRFLQLAKNRKAKLKKGWSRRFMEMNALSQCPRSTDDVITVGQCKLKIKDGQASSDELSKSKRFGGMDPAELKEKVSACGFLPTLLGSMTVPLFRRRKKQNFLSKSSWTRSLAKSSEWSL